jgi:hypothetical protein
MIVRQDYGLYTNLLSVISLFQVYLTLSKH